MSQLTFKEFIKLPHKEQCIREKDLNDHDRFLARMNEPLFEYNATPDLTPEQIAALPPDLQRLYHELENED